MKNPERDTLSPAQRRLLETMLADRGMGPGRRIRPRQDQTVWPLSFAQQRLWFLEQMEPGGSAYILPSAVIWRGPLDVPVLERSLREIVRRHEILRSTISNIDGSAVQHVSPEPRVALPVIDLAARPADVRQAEVMRLAEAETRKAMDLVDGPLFRSTLLRLGPQEHVLLTSIHHIVFDGWSQGVIAQELAALYQAFSAGRPSPLAELPLQYADYAQWQQEWLGSGKLQEELDYWRSRLTDAPAALDLPSDRPRPAVQTTRGARHTLQLSPRVLSSLKNLAKKEAATIYMVLLAAFKVLLWRYSHQEDVLVGTPIAGRNQPETEGLIGLFLNTLVMRTSLSGDPTFRELLQRVKDTCLGAYAHQDLPFEKLVEELQPQRDASRSPLFQVMFILQVTPKSTTLGGLTFDVLVIDPGTSKFDLTLFLGERETGDLFGHFEYNTDLFDASTIERLAGNFETLVDGLLANPDAKIGDLPILSQRERQQVLLEWNQTERPYPADRGIHHLFEAQALATPDGVAVEFERDTLTYAALDARANRLARYLRDLGAGPERRVALCVERSLDMVVALLAILKTGAAYVPLDPAYPGDRIKLMIEDSEAVVLVSQEGLADSLPKTAATIVWLDKERARMENGPAEPVAYSPAGDDLAYLIYTSGSTGTPKGVMVTHRGVVNFLKSMQREPGLGQSDRLLAVTTLSFDIAGLEIWLPLISGARVIVASRETTIDGHRLMREMARTRPTIVQATPATWRMLIESGWRGSPDLKVLCGGEALPRDLADALLERSGSVWNMYGPTETTIWSTVWRVERGAPITVGHPIDNTELFILDAQHRLLPIGAAGELYIGGAGVARGYWHREELTAEKFVPNPFDPSRGRLYRTGDLACWRADGQVTHLGRLDFQVKVRGHRIELGEIEAALAKSESVVQAVVVAREDTPGDVRLVAYVVPKGEVESSLWRQQLRERLPEYMVPSVFVKLPQLPLTPNGKVDRRALPAPSSMRAERGTRFVPVQSETERLIAMVWSEVLKVETIGREDNFFDLGGHSLLLTKVHNRLARLVSKDVTILDLFRFPSVSALAAFLNGDTEERATPGHAEAVAPRREREPIAIIGMSGRFPSAESVDELWQKLASGTELMKSFSREELIELGVDPAVVDKPGYIRSSAVLSNPDFFDAPFFGLTPREAEITDPQHRLALECAHATLEDAGYDPQTYAGRIGVFAGAGMSTYLVNNIASNPAMLTGVGPYQVFISNDKDFVPTRISYKLNLRGPSINVQTACSTSLVAVHLACQSLLNGECEMAMAGGVSVPAMQGGYFYQEDHILSPDGHCRTFDAKAQGTVPGSGVAMVLLKRLSDALADGDAIRAVILGSAINNDGARKVGYTAPSIEGQAQAIVDAQQAAGVDPQTISYVEAHGTATRLGDPIEVSALTQAFRRTTDERGFCGLGSIKSNLGHLDIAAGVAGLIKTALQLQHRQLAPSLHFDRPNPAIDFAASPFFVNATLRDWTPVSGVRRAGVSSFGIGGTNAHVVVEEAPPAPDSQESSRQSKVLLMSAKTATALESATRNLQRFLEASGEVNLSDVAYTTQVGRSVHPFRRAVICRTRDEAVTALKTLEAQRVWTNEGQKSITPVAFLFPGQGSQHIGMARDLYEQEPRFREELDRCAELLAPSLAGADLRRLIFPSADDLEAAEQELNQTRIAQPAIFAIEYSLAQLWMSWGVKPEAMLGHSIGEYVAACLAGVMSLEDALSLVALRGRLMQSLPSGAMLAVDMTEHEAMELAGDGLSLAAVNGLKLCVLSGSHDAIARVEEKVAAKGAQARRLRTSHAFHSAMMDPILTAFTNELNSIELEQPRIPFLSNVTGTWIRAEQATDPQYWARHLRQTVRFSDGLAVLCEQPRVCLEVGPGQTLASLLRRHPAKTPEHTVLSSMRHSDDRRSDEDVLLGAAARLWIEGVRLDWKSFSSGEKRRRVALPTYPFERQRYWVPPGKGRAIASGDPAEVSKRSDVSTWFYVPVWKQAPPAALARKVQPSSIATVVFADACGVGEALAKTLLAQNASVCIVRAGKELSRSSDGSWVIDPSRPAHYAEALRAIAANSEGPFQFVHLWGITAEDGHGSFEVSQQRGYYSILHLMKALSSLDGSPRLHVVTNNVCDVTGTERLDPAKATVLGPCLVGPQEHPNLSCVVLDVDLETSSAGRVAEALAREICSVSAARRVALRGGRRWTLEYEPVVLGADDPQPIRLRDKGVYLITGGLGSVGLSLATALATESKARLILVGRSGPRPGVSDYLRSLETAGAEIMVARADVADAAQMKNVVRDATSRFGSINGVIHAAGIMGPEGSAYLQETDRALTELQFWPKVHGLNALEEAVNGCDLDFCLLTSSISTVLGGLRFSAYAAANFYMDAFVSRLNRTIGRPWTSINWDAWRFGEDAQPTTGLASLALTADEGRQVLLRVLARPAVDQLVVSTGDLQGRVRQWVEPRAEESTERVPEAAAPAHNRPELQTAFAAPETEIERAVAHVWQELLGVAGIGLHDNFFELGGHSLLATQVLSRLRELFKTDLPMRALFDTPTVSGLAAAVSQRLGGAAATAEAIASVQPDADALLLEKLETMSEEEVSELLSALQTDGKAKL